VTRRKTRGGCLATLGPGATHLITGGTDINMIRTAVVDIDCTVDYGENMKLTEKFGELFCRV